MNSIEQLRIFKGIEYLAKAIDFSNLTYTEFCRTDLGDDSFVIELDEESFTCLGLVNPYIVRDNNKRWYSYSLQQLEEENLEVNTKIAYVALLEVIKLLKNKAIIDACDFTEEDLDPNWKEKVQQIDAEWDYTKAYDCEIKRQLSIDYTAEEVKTLLALCQYPTKLAQDMYDAYKTPQKFFLKEFEDFEVVDNRIIIPLSQADKWRMKKYIKKSNCNPCYVDNINAIVISKNLNDYFYCSYGNAFQSCFALNSPHAYWYGYLPFYLDPASYIVYATTGEVHKTVVISGNKFHCPDMILRCWAYANEDKELVLDKKYFSSTNCSERTADAIINLLHERFEAIVSGKEKLYNGGRTITEIWTRYQLPFFSDSLRLELDDAGNTIVVSSFSNGYRTANAGSTIPFKKEYNSLIQKASTVSSVSPDLDLSKHADIINGVLLNPKKCPITGLNIECKEKVHRYAKYFTRPSTDTAVLVYYGGRVFYEEVTRTTEADSVSGIFVDKYYTGRFEGGKIYVGPINNECECSISLKVLKEHIKGNIKNSIYNAILLKVIDGDKITFQVFKRKEKANERLS
jgi:hypothetical protein